MEEDISKPETAIEKRVKQRLQTAIKKAEGVINYEAAHNEELIRALEIVLKFLKDKKRVCYGGTAMNAILPEGKRFYNMDYDLPDYDFFTPDPDEDIEELVHLLKKAKFENVYSKIGMHEGTKKVLVNFSPIADITYLSPTIYPVFFKRAVIRNGVRYTDPEILRMMMYLELSRPKGEVSRWEKVYERLQLINKEFPPKKALGYTRKATTAVKKTTLPCNMHDAVFRYCIDGKRSLITGDLDIFYEKAITASKNPQFNVSNYKGIIGWLTPDLKTDAKKLQAILGGPQLCRIFLHPARSEIVSEYIEITYKDVPAVLLVRETACHSYLTFPVKDGRSIYIASLDTLITLYYSIAIFTIKARQYIPKIETKIAKLVALDEKNRVAKNPKIPAFPLICHGYQKGYSTLLRERIERVQEEKKILMDL
jgi:Poly(A) polymerase catalytic subunit